MLSNLKEEKITTIHVAEKELQWYKKNHEILVDGKMFDVKSIELKDGVYEITGLFDDMETELNAMLEEIHSDAGKKQEKSISIYQVCLGLISDSPTSSFDLNTIWQGILTTYPLPGQSVLSKGFFHPFFTPPRA